LQDVAVFVVEAEVKGTRNRKEAKNRQKPQKACKSA